MKQQILKSIIIILLSGISSAYTQDINTIRIMLDDYKNSIKIKSYANIGKAYPAYGNNEKLLNTTTMKAELQYDEAKIIQKPFSTLTLLALVIVIVLLLFYNKIAIQKKKLAEEKKDSIEKQYLATQYMLEGEIQEQHRIAKDLHDGLGGLLTATKLSVGNMKQSEELKCAINLLDESIKEMRKISHHLIQESLHKYGLEAAVKNFCNVIPNTRFQYLGETKRFDAKIELVMYRIAFELINNAHKHSGASEIVVQFIQEPNRIALTIEDNGNGFDLNEQSKGIGLKSIFDKVQYFKGIININSSIGAGTTAYIEFSL